jgi:Na+/H+ antiporter
MALFEWTLILLFIAVVLVGVGRRIGAPYPSLLALAGAGIAFLPDGPTIEIEPDLALALFVAPALLDSAFDTSPRDLKRNAFPLASLVVVMVALTTVTVAYVGWAYGGLPIAAAIALGAIVAPPDAVAASAVLSQLRLPRRVMQILQGESLLNDATALLIYRLAVGAAAGGVTLAHAGPMIAIAAFGSVVAGFVLARLYVIATARIEDAASTAVLSFVGTFGVWILAERLGLSAILTIVVYAMTLAHVVPARTPARLRVSIYSVWETVVFVLNVLAFLVMGLQVRPILERLEGAELNQALIVSGLVLATVIAVRVIYVMAYNTTVRLKNRWFGVDLPEGVAPPTFRGGVLVAWCGMRGLVTLATAFALPQEFPGRDLIVLSAFTVVLGTLVVQGLTLKPLLKLLAFKDDNSVEREVSLARIAIMETALTSLIGVDTQEAAHVREGYVAARAIAENIDAPQGATAHDELRLKTIEAQRAKLSQMRDSGEIGDEAYHRLEEELDWAELNAAPAGYFQPLNTDAPR